MGKWGQSPTYTVSHDPQEIERSPFQGVRGRGAKIGPLVRGFLGVGGEDCQEPACAAESPKTVQAWRKRLKRV